MLPVIAYDIAEDRRRDAVSTLLADHGRRVNHSVFECELERETFEVLRERLSQLIHPRQDSVLFYRLCEDCRTRIQSLGRSTKGPDNSGAVII